MSSQFFSSTGVQGYSSFWNKYRPAILQLMVAADESPQTYQFYKHELKAINSKEKSFTFKMKVMQGKPVDNFKLSTIAKDLFEVLSLSPRGNELMNSGDFEFSLDKQFIFHVIKSENEDEAEDSGNNDTQTVEETSKSGKTENEEISKTSDVQ